MLVKWRRVFQQRRPVKPRHTQVLSAGDSWNRTEETRESESRAWSVTSHLQECSVNYTIIDPRGLNLNLFRLSFDYPWQSKNVGFDFCLYLYFTFTFVQYVHCTMHFGINRRLHSGHLWGWRRPGWSLRGEVERGWEKKRTCMNLYCLCYWN